MENLEVLEDIRAELDNIGQHLEDIAASLKVLSKRKDDSN